MSLISVLSEIQIKENTAQAIKDFGMNVLNAITEANDDNNFNNVNNVISPLSLSTAMGMVHLGANGETSNELRQVLGFNADKELHNSYKSEYYQKFAKKSTEYVLDVENKVMTQIGFSIQKNFLHKLTLVYDAFAEKTINELDMWVRDNTGSCVTAVPLKPYTGLVIVNAVYFKGKWLHKFISTMHETFINNGDTEVTVQFMSGRHTNYNFTASEELYADILEMRYIGGHISMYIVLPHTVNGLQKTTSALTEQKLKTAINSMSPKSVDLYLPKFKIEVSYKLVVQLKSLGIKNIFTENADLTGITKSRRLLVSDVAHKVFLEVNEEGGVVDDTTMSGSVGPPTVLKVDHPFIVVIRDKRNDANLIYGQITQL